jgi:hypothetical protein
MRVFRRHDVKAVRVVPRPDAEPLTVQLGACRPLLLLRRRRRAPQCRT